MPAAALGAGIKTIGSLGGAIGGVAGAAMQSSGAKDAAQMQADAANRANQIQWDMFQEQKKMYEQQRADQEPWRQAGLGALAQMGDSDFQRDFTTADFQKDPGYEFRMAEGQKALERSAAARGGLQSGGTLKALSRYGQDYASNEYQNAYNRFNSDRDRRFGRLSSLAGMGQTATNQMGTAGMNLSGLAGNYADNVSNIGLGAAKYGGAARMAGAQAWGNAITGLGKNWMELSKMGYGGE